MLRLIGHRPASSETPLNLTLMKLIDSQFMERPFYGNPEMTRYMEAFEDRFRSARRHRQMDRPLQRAASPLRRLTEGYRSRPIRAKT